MIRIRKPLRPFFSICVFSSFPFSDFGSNFSFPISVFRFRFSDFGFPISVFRFWFSDFGFLISVPTLVQILYIQFLGMYLTPSLNVHTAHPMFFYIHTEICKIVRQNASLSQNSTTVGPRIYIVYVERVLFRNCAV